MVPVVDRSPAPVPHAAGNEGANGEGDPATDSGDVADIGPSRRSPEDSPDPPENREVTGSAPASTTGTPSPVGLPLILRRRFAMIVQAGESAAFNCCDQSWRQAGRCECTRRWFGAWPFCIAGSRRTGSSCSPTPPGFQRGISRGWVGRFLRPCGGGGEGEPATWRSSRRPSGSIFLRKGPVDRSIFLCSSSPLRTTVAFSKGGVSA